MKIKLTILSSIAFLLAFFNFVSAVNKVDLYFFYGQGCSHCAKAEKFLSQLENNEKIDVHRYEVFRNRANANLLSFLGKKLRIDTSGVPIIIVGSKSIFGFQGVDITGKEINNIVGSCIDLGCTDKAGPLIQEYVSSNTDNVDNSVKTVSETATKRLIVFFLLGVLVVVGVLLIVTTAKRVK